MPFRITPLPPPRAFRATPRPNDTFNRFRGSKVPDSGWTQQSFQTSEGKKLIRDVLAVRRLALRGNSAKLSKALRGMMEDEVSEVLGVFASLVDKRVNGKSIGSRLINVILTLNVPDGSESIWEEALDLIFSRDPTRGRILKVFKPHYQSVMDHIVTKTSVIIPPPVPQRRLSEDLIPVTGISTPELPPWVPMTPAQQTKLITAKADNLCHKVTRISETTKGRLRSVFRKHIKDGSTVSEVVKAIQDNFPQIADNRIHTIVRTELSRAANEAQIMAFQNSLSVTHCSVTGCQAVEEASPTYRGFHTCNLRNVPVADLQLVEFHINHTGAWVPTGFRNDDGTVPVLALGNSPGIGHYDNPNALRHTDRVAAGLGTVAQLNRHP